MLLECNVKEKLAVFLHKMIGNPSGFNKKIVKLQSEAATICKKERQRLENSKKKKHFQLLHLQL